MAIYEGLIVNHDQEVFEGQIEINPDNGLIERVVNLANSRIGSPKRKFDEKCRIFAGMSDVHIHSREDETGKHIHKEEHRTAGNAALNGGVVCVMYMPNQFKPTIDKETLAWQRKRVAQINHPVTMLPYVGIGKNTSPLEDENVPYKAYLGPSVGDLFFDSGLEFLKAMPKYKRKNISFHVEDNYILRISKDKETHDKRRPVECITSALSYLLPAIEELEIDAKLCHWSTGGQSFDMIKYHREIMKKKNLDYDTKLEASPMHLLFDSDMLKERPELWPYMQMNPAIQGREHRMQLIEALRSGFIDILASDHAPHTLDEKFKNFKRFQYSIYSINKSLEEIHHNILETDPEICKQVSCEDGTSGAPWLDTHSSVITELVKKYNFDYQDIARVAAYNPGMFVNQFLDESYGKGFGRIEEGYQGSLTIINFDSPAIIERDDLQTKCGWSPLEGKIFPGHLEAVIIRGKDMTNQFIH